MAPSKKPQTPPGQEKKTEKDYQRAVDESEERNALIAACDEVNLGNRHSWKMSRKEIETIWGKNALKGNKLPAGLYEYKGLPVELEE